jgi:hypothetical protein
VGQVEALRQQDEIAACAVQLPMMFVASTMTSKSGPGPGAGGLGPSHT